jgi:hypothetical protein
MGYRPQALEALQQVEPLLNASEGICCKSCAILAGRSYVLDRRFINGLVEV